MITGTVEKGGLIAAISRHWFSISTAAAPLFLLLYNFEENRVTRSLPLEPRPEAGAVFSFSNHTDHQKHFLTAEQHHYVAHLLAALIVYWLAVCAASWIGPKRSGSWVKFVSSYTPAKGAGWIVSFGVVVACLLLMSA